MNLPSQSQTADSINPHLPNEVLFKILGYVDSPKDLVQWRTVSRAWHEMTTHHIFEKGVPVKFFTENPVCSEVEEIDKPIQQFLDTMEGRLQGTKFPFSKFEFAFYKNQCPINKEEFYIHPNLASFEKLADTVGSFVKHYVIHLEPHFAGDTDQVLEVILAQAPNLEKLSVYGHNDKDPTAVALNSSFHLPKLKYIEVMPYSEKDEICLIEDYNDHLYSIKFDHFTSWFSNAPALQVVKCGFGVEVTSDIQATEYFRILQTFDAVELELCWNETILVQKLIARPLPTLHTLHLHTGVGPELVLALLKCTAVTLHKLELSFASINTTIPMLPNLEVLELGFGFPDSISEPYLSSPLQAAQFPNLKSLTLREYSLDGVGEDEVGHLRLLFDGSIFDTVQKLDLLDCNDCKRPCPQSEPWDTLFPNVSEAFQPPTSKLLDKSRQISMRQYTFYSYMREFGDTEESA